MTRRAKERLVSEYFERVSGRLLDEYRPLIRDLIRGHAGVYALYKQERLYYVGLASNLMGRVNQHLGDRHKGKWDHFSVYLTTTTDHIRALEALVLRIVNPTGNRASGRLPAAQDLARRLSRMMSERDKDHRATLLGGGAARRHRRKKAKTGKGSQALANQFDRSKRLYGWYRNRRYTAALRRDGQIRYNRRLYDSPHVAAAKAKGRRANGWRFWHFQDKNKEWIPLAHLRQ
jgi:hypothetical protein